MARAGRVETSGPGPALRALGAALDASVARIQAAADPRHYDRFTIWQAADVWDPLTFPFARAATARTRWRRERHAGEALRRISTRGAHARALVREQAGARWLAPERPRSPHGRDYRGVVWPGAVPVTVATLGELAADYDLAAATLRSVAVERVGADRLAARLRCAVPRTYLNADPDPEAGGPAGPAPELFLVLPDLLDVSFELPTTPGLALRCGPDGESVVAFEGGGVLRAVGAELSLDDRDWHRSGWGRRIDAELPPNPVRGPRRRREESLGALGGAALLATRLLHLAMLEIRHVRYGDQADRVPARALAGQLVGAGAAFVAAGAEPPGERREAAFRELAAAWGARGDPEGARWFAVQRAELAGRPPIATSPARPARSARSGRSRWPPSEALLQRVACHVAPGGPSGRTALASAVVQLALPPPASAARADEGWRLRSLHVERPDRVRLRAGAFRAPGRPVVAGGPADPRGFALRGAEVTTGR